MSLTRPIGRAMWLVASLVFIPLPAVAQSQNYSPRLVETSQGPTNILAIGLDERRAGHPVLVLQAGAGVALEQWAGWVAGLGEIAPVVTFDRPGTGRSPYRGGSLYPDGMTRHTRAVLDALGVAPPYVLVGHSWGAELIGRFARDRPEEVSGLVFLDPTPRFSSEFMLAAGFGPEALAARVDSLHAVAVSAQAEGVAAEGAVMRYVLTGTAPDGLPVIPDLPVPIAVLLAAEPSPENAAFTAMKVEYFSEAVQGRANATLVVDTGIGHMVYEADSQLAAEVVRRVVRDAIGGSGR